ncbi:MAG: restriction endonuclease [Chthoniobacterales bacterium]
MPRRKSSFVEDLILCPWWVSVVLAAVAWVALRVIVPTIQFGNPLLKALPSFAEQIAPLGAFALLALAALSALRAWQNRRILDGQTGLESLRELPWKTFEDILGEAYRRQGYKVEETLCGGADGGVDLVLGKNGQIIVVQCKRWRGNKPVPVQVVRELYGVMVDQKASAAKVVATTNFTSDAVGFAKGKPIELVNSKALLELVRDVQSAPHVTMPANEPDYLAPSCPNCSTTMILRQARRGKNAGGKFWGCRTYPQCRGTRPV